MISVNGCELMRTDAMNHTLMTIVEKGCEHADKCEWMQLTANGRNPSQSPVDPMRMQTTFE